MVMKGRPKATLSIGRFSPTYSAGRLLGLPLRQEVETAVYNSLYRKSRR